MVVEATGFALAAILWSSVVAKVASSASARDYTIVVYDGILAGLLVVYPASPLVAGLAAITFIGYCAVHLRRAATQTPWGSCACYGKWSSRATQTGWTIGGLYLAGIAVSRSGGLFFEQAHPQRAAVVAVAVPFALAYFCLVAATSLLTAPPAEAS